MNEQHILIGLFSVALGAGLVGCQSAPVKPENQAENTQQQPSGDQVKGSQSLANSTELKSDLARETKTQNDASLAAEPTATEQSSAQQSVARQASPTESAGHDNAKRDFQYGPGQAWPKLVVPAVLIPGPLAAIPAPESVPHERRPDQQSPILADNQVPTKDRMPPTLAGPCASPLSAASLDLGPKEDWLTSKLKTTAMGALSKMLFGGSGGGGSAGGSSRPPTVSDPIPESARQEFHDQLSDIEMSISGRLQDDALLLSTDIGSAPDNSTFHAVYLERKDCKRTFPDRYLNYRMWVEWSLSVTWTKTERRYENDSLVSEKTSSGGFSKSGEYDLAKGSINLADAEQLQQGLLEDLPTPIWQQMGFSSPTSGVRGLGSQFKQVDTANLFNGDSVAVVHVTRVVDGRYVTRALPFKMERGVGDLLKFSRL